MALEAINLSVTLRRSRDGADIPAVNGVSFTLYRGRTLGIVGESGCGKSTTAMSLLRLLPRTARIAGQIRFRGEDLLAASEERLRAIRGRYISMIFQDPMVALDPLFTIGDQLAEPLRIHCGLEGDALRARQVELLAAVGISTPETRLTQYPHQMSGGMLQRIVGAIAMSCNPDVLIADEPTTALDPRAQASYLDLLKMFGETYGLALVMVTHDMGVVARVCDDVLVMYAGQAVEKGPVRQIFNAPKHPYTRALLTSIPNGEVEREWLPTIAGQPPDLSRLPPGCSFAPRCSAAQERCSREAQIERVVGDRHRARCWRAVAP
ncbi:ABC transporter ATP-binding protein [Sphingosinicella terrae]|uniref:ABC transporter ATP-binding protein n=1 Tax=Sphingosinicella terrae TaxID=2172047 RepID=UPI0013B39918|nr:ABC transporter ATP-binding protein [Sphingosinicella terrae]